MKQTAVEWLEEQFEESYSYINEIFKDTFEQAQQMEKEQSLNFAKHCLDKAKDLDVRTAFLNVEQYYETFKTKQK